VQGGVPLDTRVGAALQLLDLNTISIMREATHDTKLLLASGPSAIVLSFRGTASAAAAWADLQVGNICDVKQVLMLATAGLVPNCVVVQWIDAHANGVGLSIMLVRLYIALPMHISCASAS
jgi:hypothetical protein